jgi:hypothetical protein
MILNSSCQAPWRSGTVSHTFAQQTGGSQGQHQGQHDESKKLQYVKATDHIPAWMAQNKEEWSAPIQSTKKKTSTKPQPEIVMADKASIMSK